MVGHGEQSRIRMRNPPCALGDGFCQLGHVAKSAVVDNRD
jgi:hypothetical protein